VLFDAEVPASVEVADEVPAGPKGATRDVDQGVLRPQPLGNREVELQAPHALPIPAHVLAM